MGVVGIAVTFFFVENLTGEDLAMRDAKFRAYLVANGWIGEMGEEDLKGLAGEGREIERVSEASEARKDEER